jgi:hypothetical protein
VKQALVINCSLSTPTHHCYNLGARKLTDWLKMQDYQVAYYDGDPGMWELDADLVCLSVIFSWHAPIAREIALRLKHRAEVWCGGPGMFALRSWWHKETGLEIVRGLDQRFEKQRGKYEMCFASRGCPVNCSFCIVPRLEGLTFSFDPDFQPAPILCDNNLSALPADYQEYIIDRYRAFKQPLIDANSGFEPRYFDFETYQRWKPIMRTAKAWRFALDETRELPDVERMLRILKDEPARRKQVYCLIGNEPIEQCYARAQRIIELGGEPYCQFILPLNLVDDPSTPHAKVKLRHDWQTYWQGKDFMRYYNKHFWRSFPIWKYRPRTYEPPPFALLLPQEVLV